MSCLSYKSEDRWWLLLPTLVFLNSWNFPWFPTCYKLLNALISPWVTNSLWRYITYRTNISLTSFVLSGSLRLSNKWHPCKIFQTSSTGCITVVLFTCVAVTKGRAFWGHCELVPWSTFVSETKGVWRDYYLCVLPSYGLQHFTKW